LVLTDSKILEIFFFGLFMGYTGAIPPGPVLASTLHFSINRGFLSGFKVVLGHLSIEAVILPLLLIGVLAVIGEYESIIGMIGGVALILFGVLLILSEKSEKDDSSPVKSPVISGVITSSANPYFWIWWATVGVALLTEALKYGYFGIALFMSGHWFADISWYAFVSSAASKTSEIMDEKAKAILLRAVAVSMAIFGLYFILRSQHIL